MFRIKRCSRVAMYGTDELTVLYNELTVLYNKLTVLHNVQDKEREQD